MITNLKQLRFYLFADRVINGYDKRPLWKLWMSNDWYIMKFLRLLRISEYLDYKKHHNFIFWIPYLFYARAYRHISLKLGFDIPYNTIGYGVRLPHYGSFIINGACRIGNYCAVMPNVVIADANPKCIGNGVLFGTNVVVAKNIKISNGVQISANSFVNKSIEEECYLVGGGNSQANKTGKLLVSSRRIFDGTIHSY
jgi:serine O-acetyltransferase